MRDTAHAATDVSALVKMHRLLQYLATVYLSTRREL